MIVTRTPLRISLCSSGGSDLPAYYREGIPGLSLTAAITRYMYITVNPKFDQRWRLCYSRTEEVERYEDLEHDLARESIGLVGMPFPLEIHSCCDVPAGTGLGSSSAYTVGLIHALRVQRNQYPVDPMQLADRACQVEIERCRHPIGKQDQYACALGGIRLLKFDTDGSVTTSPMSNVRMAGEFKKHLLLFWTGRARSADHVLAKQSEKMSDPEYREMVFQVAARSLSFAKALSSGDWHLCGEILDETWLMKRGLSSGISDPQIDAWYGAAREQGAWGGKICGAGGGGFLLIIAPPDFHYQIREAVGLKDLSFDFDMSGSTIIYPRGD